MNSPRRPIFYFYLRPQGSPTEAGYQHCTIAIAEGLRTLGIPFYSNINYWNEGGEYLFQAGRDVRPEDCDVLLTSDDHETVGRIKEELFGGGRKTVYIDSSDGWRTRTEAEYYRRFDVVLRTHCSTRYRYPDNVHPWAFGLTRRILSACSHPQPFLERKPRALVNFRASHPVRRAAADLVIPALETRFPPDLTIDEPPARESGQERIYWEATGRRHYPTFFNRLQRTMACAAFGGYFAPGVFRSTESLPERALYALAWRLGKRTRTILQFDSWRFWESMAAGCLTLQANYERYGCSLPVEPESETQYIGIDFGERDCARFVRESDLNSLSIVAQEGRRWAIEHYSPQAAAGRLLRLLGNLN